MAIQPNNTLSTLASGTPGTFLTTDSSGSISWSKRDGEEREIGAFLTWYWSWTDSDYECGNWESYLNEQFPMYDEDKMIDFIEFALEIIGVDLKYSDFKEMSVHERVAFIRDLKIDRLLKGGVKIC